MYDVNVDNFNDFSLYEYTDDCNSAPNLNIFKSLAVHQNH